MSDTARAPDRACQDAGTLNVAPLAPDRAFQDSGMLNVAQGPERRTLAIARRVPAFRPAWAGQRSLRPVMDEGYVEAFGQLGAANVGSHQVREPEGRPT